MVKIDEQVAQKRGGVVCPPFNVFCLDFFGFKGVVNLGRGRLDVAFFQTSDSGNSDG